MHNNLVILEFLMVHNDSSFSARELCDALDLSLYSLRWAMVDLLVQGFVVVSRGRPKRYRLSGRIVELLTKN